MKYNELTIKRSKTPHRVGRGISAGRGKTAGRGTKGQGARKSSTKQGFAGGQTPLHMQLPKLRGFKSKHRSAEVVYTGQLDSIKPAVIDSNALFEAGMITSPNLKIKLIVQGEVKTKKTVKVQAASTGAIAAVEAAGGKVEIVTRTARTAKSAKIVTK